MSWGRLFGALLAALPVACASTLTAPAATRTEVTPAASASAGHPAPSAIPPANPNRCKPPAADVRSAVTQPPPPNANEHADAGCRAVSERDLSQTEATLRARYHPRIVPSRVFLSFDCDPVRLLSQVDLQSAQGDKRDVSLLRVSAVGNRYRVVALRVRALDFGAQAYDYRAGDRFEVTLSSGEFESAALDAPLERARTALHATVREIPLAGFLPSASGSGGGAEEVLRLSVSGYARLQAPGDPAPSLQSQVRSFSGPRSAALQADYLPLELAREPLAPVLAGLKLSAAPVSPQVQDDARSLYRDSFVATFEHAPSFLKELYLALASRYGSIDLAPALSQVALSGTDREQVLAVNALAAVTGWDARFDERGVARDVHSAAAAYAAECAR